MNGMTSRTPVEIYRRVGESIFQKLKSGPPNNFILVVRYNIVRFMVDTV